MRKVDENCEGALMEETLFSMNFASKGLAWAENVLQKLENVNLEDIIPKSPTKYVDAVGEHLRKVCEDVADDWLNSFSDGCLKVPVSDLSLEHEIIAEICGKSKLGLKQHPITEKPPSDTALTTSSFSEANSDLTIGIYSQVDAKNCDSDDVPLHDCPEGAYGISQRNIVSATVTPSGHDSNSNEKLDPEDDSRSEIWCASIASSASFIDSFYQSRLPENRAGEQHLSFASSSQENVWCDPDKQVVHTSSDIQLAFDAVEADERLDNNDDDRADFLMIDVPIDANSEVIRDAVLDESWANLERNNLVFVADRSWQSSSFRRRFRNAFRLKKDPETMKESLEAQPWCKIKHPDPAHTKRSGPTKTTGSKEDSITIFVAAEDPCEPEWEVL